MEFTIDDDSDQKKEVYRCSCGRELPLKVLESGAGFYIGTFCPDCGLNTRESERCCRRPKIDPGVLLVLPNF